MANGIYIHIPFCSSHCHYCAFYSDVVAPHHFDLYVNAVITEIRSRARKYGNCVFDTLYFGGGTPSLLGAKHLSRILDACYFAFDIDKSAEITLEMNPSIVEQSSIDSFYEIGFNRLSVGVQSFNDGLLKKIGRNHSASDGFRTVKMAHRAGFNNISIDLMYGLPGQDADMFEQSLQKAVKLPISHISVYGLIIEENTHFSRLIQQKRLDKVDEKTEWNMYQLMCRILPQYGFERYEIANFARGGRYSNHNQKYWSYGNYIGLGAGATGMINHVRRNNVSDWKEYTKAVQTGEDDYYSLEFLTPEQCISEYMFMNLRLKKGVSREAFCRYFGKDIDSVYGNMIEILEQKHLIHTSNGNICLTKKGAAVGNQVFASFLL